MNIKIILKYLISSLLLLALFLAVPELKIKVYAATLTVNSTTDATDDNPGDGVCHTAAGQCTLRAAIQEANALAGTDTISIPAGTFTLTITGAGENAAATGDLDITSRINITGAGASSTIIDGGAIDRVFELRAGSTSTAFSNVTIQNGSVTGTGGGILSSTAFTLTNVIVKNNTASTSGGGVYSSASVTLDNVTLTGNTASLNGGGIFATGGAATTLTATSTTIDHNTAAIGGGIDNDNGMNLTNVTVANNTATNEGGGIYDFSFDINANLWLNVTIGSNTAPANKGGGAFFDGSTVKFKNVLFGGNSAANCTFSGSSNQSQGNNLSSDTSCTSNFNQSTDLNNTNPLLSALADNGGSVQTMALQTGSPAIDAGSDVGGPATDARGVSRPQGAHYDIGAYEYQTPVPTATPTPTSTPLPSSSSSSTSGVSSTTQPSNCGDAKPSSAPYIFQSEATLNHVTLHINPASMPYNKYYIAYGTDYPGSEMYGVEFNQDYLSGALTYTIGALHSNTRYFFKTRAGNGCMPGDWSNNFAAQTTSNYRTQIHTTSPSGFLSPTIAPSVPPLPTATSFQAQPTTSSQKQCFLWFFFCH